MSNKKVVSDLMIKSSQVKVVREDEYFHDAIEALNSNKWGLVLVVDQSNQLKGILTDGDARRVYAKNQEPSAQLNSEPISKFMNASPFKTSPEVHAMDLMKTLNTKGYLCAPVVNGKNELLGVIHLQHLVSEFLKHL